MQWAFVKSSGSVKIVRTTSQARSVGISTRDLVGKYMNMSKPLCIFQLIAGNIKSIITTRTFLYHFNQ